MIWIDWIFIGVIGLLIVGHIRTIANLADFRERMDALEFRIRELDDDLGEYDESYENQEGD